MLSIVKMDFDSDVEILDDNVIKSETIDIEDTTICDDQYTLNNVVHDLELVPIVYTTKLDDMGVLNLDPDFMHPDEASARILKESKPVLRSYPGPPRKGRKNTRKFGKLKAILEKIYCPAHKVIKTEEIDETVIKTEQIDDPDTCPIKIDSVKSEMLNEPIFEETKSKEPCKYSELLKLCKPCSVVLVGPVLIGKDGSSQVIHGGQVLKASRVKKPRVISSSDDETPLITLYPPDSLVERKSVTISKPTPPNLLVEHKSMTVTKPAPPDLLVERKSVTKDTRVKQYKGPKLAPKPAKSNASPKIIQVDYLNQTLKEIVITSQIPPRLIRNSLLVIQDIFSNKCHIYYTDNESNLLDYFKDSGDNAHIYQSTYLKADCRYKIDNCCWVKKDECIQSLYPKVLIYPNSRFMRKPHPCKPGACTCCCRKKENVKKLDSVFTEKHHLPSGSNNQKSLGQYDIEMLDVEDKIDKTVISINKSQKITPIEKNPKSLLRKALSYKGALPTRQGDNRRLVTLKTDRENTVVVLRNYVDDVIEVYEKDTEGDIVSYLKTTCYGNTDHSDVLKILNRPNSASETVCCWFKREYVITKLQCSITLQPRAAKFIRSNHTCQSNACTCCCKPIKDEIKLQKIKLPSRSQHRVSTLKAWGLASESALNSQPSVSLGNDNDDDCQITSVMTSPIFPPQKSTIPPSAFVPEAVDGDELSKEVNSLITSILDRFKDVRLTINSDGKVAAALNTPVNTLSTVELKVLANILSYAQSQIDLLGAKVNSGMSLSNIINLKVDDVQANRAPLDPNSIYKEFSKNVNLNTNVPKESLQSINVKNTPMVFPQAPAVPQTYTFFTDSTSVKNQHFNDAFSSYISSKIDSNPETFTPVIQNVYSLKDSGTDQATEGTDDDSSFTTVWYRKPAQSNAFTLSEESDKQNTSKKGNEDRTSSVEAVQSKKIRVLSPTKLHAATVKSEGSATTITIPNLTTAAPKGVMPGIIILPNNNFNVQSLGETHAQGMVNGMPPATVSHPVLIINPLHNAGGLVSAPIGNDNDTLDMAGTSHPQSKIPVVINAATTSHLFDNGSNVVTQQIMPTSVPTSMHTDVSETLDKDPFPDNNPDIDDEPEMSGASEMDNDSNMDSNENDVIEMKYSPENNEEEEEDCILGF